MNRYLRIFYDQNSGAGSGGAAVADAYDVPAGAQIDIRADGSVVIVEPGVGGDVNTPAAAPAPLTAADFRGFGENLVGAVRDVAGGQQPAGQKPADPPVVPQFDATRYIKEDETIDMKGLGEGVTAFATEIAKRAAGAALAEAEARYGGTTSSVAAEQFAARICEGLGPEARATVVQRVAGMTPAQIAAIDEDNIEMLRDHAAKREERKAALTTDIARPGGVGGGGRETALTLNVPDPKGIGWPGYCATMDLNPRDPKVIADARRSGILK